MSIGNFVRRTLAGFWREKENCFDHIISLGYNCEVTFRFLKYFNFEETSLFNWAYTYSVNDLINILNNIYDIGKDGFAFPNPLWECNKTRIRFHGKRADSKDASAEILEEDKIELTERTEYLREKFLKILRSNETKLYIYKIRHEELLRGEGMNAARQIREALLNMGGKNFKILIVYEKEENFKPEQMEDCIFRFVKYFAHENDVTNKKYMSNGWNEIYDEFGATKTHKKKIKKRYKFENIS